MVKRILLLLVALAAVFLTACGETKVVHKTAVVNSRNCALGVMGGCVPHEVGGPSLNATAASAPLIPDVSEYQPCRVYSPFIYRIYEAGTRAEDRNAICHSEEARRLGVWSGAYYFARPGSCIEQAHIALAVARSLPRRPNVLIVDAEVWLPEGYVKCADATIKAGGFAYVNYTAPGLAPAAGGPFQTPIWVADYGGLACIQGICGRVAHQFSEGYPCRGVYGDCSFDEGITKLGVAAPVARRKVLTIRQQQVIALGVVWHRMDAHHCWRKRGGLRRFPPRVSRWCHGWEGERQLLRRKIHR